MKCDIPIRIRVLRPMPEAAMKVQRGKDELLAAVASSDKELVFEFELSADLSGDAPNFLGKFAQGPKSERFVYVNSGKYAGNPFTQWNRRAKISLMSITGDQVRAVAADPKLVLETEFEGVGRDGGPTCASVKGIEWKVQKR